ncbi:MAG: TlpA disulfide reductase family protein [Chloroflexi bacterium]|nr:TlpA disulfide reductase family protein [Chloroflexota bacterium]
MTMSEPFDQLEFLDEATATPAGRGLSPGSLALLAAVLALALVIALQLSRRNAGRPTSGAAPDFSLALFDGGEFSLSDYRDQVVLINFWASWCPPCRDEAPDLQALYADYRESGFTVIGVNMLESSRRKALDFIAEFGLTYPNGEDLGERVTNLYRVEAPPESFLIDGDGVVRRFFIGSLRYDDVSGSIEALLAEKT